MIAPAAVRPIVLDRLPPDTFRAVVVYLDDVLRECQLVLVGQSQGGELDTTLVALAAGLVPNLEAVGDAFRSSGLSTNDDGTLRLEGTLAPRFASTIASLQVQLVQLRVLGRDGELLIESDPQVAQLVTWICEECADQLAGRGARPYVVPG